MKAILFDLDDTLVNSSHLRCFRDCGDWSEVKRQIESVKPYDGIIQMLNQIRSRDVRVGIVTNSPRWYSERILSNCRIPYDALVAAEDAKLAKPDSDATWSCMRALEVIQPVDVVAVGDRCIDIRSARSMRVKTIGALWGCQNRRDLKLARPEFLADAPDDVTTITASLWGVVEIHKHEWWHNFRSNLWITIKDWDNREHLANSGISYSIARISYGGKIPAWSRSYTNQLISNLKSKEPKQCLFKDEAAKVFAFELREVLLSESYVVFVMPSALKNSSEYDNRWELVRHHLETTWKRTDLKFQQAVMCEYPSIPAHLQNANSEDRNPVIIAGRLTWVGGIPNENVHIAVIDDVLTKGGHLRAYHDLIKAHCPEAKIHLLPWAAYTDATWHETPARFLD
jgi:phosphoglycolate phosphatase-like HAD superfamily hydrolase